MTLEDRLRAGLRRPAHAIALDLDADREAALAVGRRRRRTRRVGAGAGALVAAVVLGVGSMAIRDEPKDALFVTEPGPVTTSVPSPTTTSTSTTSSTVKVPRRPGPARPDNTGDFVNGHQYVYITELDSSRRELTVDGALWFTGQEGDVARAEDGETRSFDYYVRNENARLRTLRLAIDCEIGLVDGTRDPSLPAWEGDSMVHRATLEDLAADLADPDRTDEEGRHSFGFWIDIRDGVIVRIEEQYRP